MTSASHPEAARTSAVSDHQIVDFLRANPAFLDHHPELLGELSIPHGSGDAVSLLERQVAVLRDDNGRLKKQLDEFMRMARQNDALNGKIHALVLTLMNAVGPQAIFASLERCLREDFGADRVFNLILAEPAFVDGDALRQFVGAAAGVGAAFADLIASEHTRCGPLSAAERRALFAEAEFNGSAVAMPLLGKAWNGVLVIASNNAERYQAGMGTEFLNYLRDIVTLVVDPWVKRVPAG